LSKAKLDFPHPELVEGRMADLQRRYCRNSRAGIGLLELSSLTQTKFAASFVLPWPEQRGT
jgi:hypothetical protein